MADQQTWRITTTEMHTGGEPLRIIEGGVPPILGSTVLEKRRYLRDNLDHLRRLLIFEPRGHYDMYGVFLVPVEGADIGAIFVHNEGYSTMCGHAVLALGRYLVDKGVVKNPASPETKVTIQCPCGPVEVFVEYSRGRTGRVRFLSVPAFVFATDVKVTVPGYGTVTLDVSYGGAFYAILPAASVGLDVRTTPVEKLKEAATEITHAVNSTLKPVHPESDDLSFLYGTILTDGADQFSDEETANICVFADKEVDRSPTGSGVTARIALQHHRGRIELGQVRRFMGPAGSVFTGSPVSRVKFGPHDAVTVEVAGQGHYCGSATFTLEEDDVIGKGFLLK